MPRAKKTTEPEKSMDKATRTFVQKNTDHIKITSDERGDEVVIWMNKLNQINCLVVDGIVDREPVLAIQIGASVASVSFNSRTNVFKARDQLLEILKPYCTE